LAAAEGEQIDRTAAANLLAGTQYVASKYSSGTLEAKRVSNTCSESEIEMLFLLDGPSRTVS